MIQIETEKIVNGNGIHGRIIIKFKGLYGLDKIPERYRAGDNCMWGTGYGLIFKCNMNPNHECADLIIGQFYSETAFQQSLLEVARCGEIDDNYFGNNHIQHTGFTNQKDQ